MKGFTLSEILDMYDWEREHWYKVSKEHIDKVNRKIEGTGKGLS